MGLIGGAISAVGAIQSANAQAAAMEAQAKQMKQEGAYQLNKSGFEANAIIDDAKVTAGQAVAGYSSTGLDVTSGTPHDKINIGIFEPAAFRKSIKVAEGQQAWGQAKYGAKIKTMEAAQVRQAGMFQALTPIIGAFGQMGSMGGGMFG